MFWEVYIVLSEKGSLYTGIARDAQRRFYEHLEDYSKGAKFFRGNPPITVMYREPASDRSSASKREYAIKKLSRIQKEALIESQYQ